MRAQIAKVVGGLAIVTLLLVGAVAQPAQADQYPSWSDVVSARHSVAAKAAAVARIQGILNQLQRNLDAATASAQTAGDAYSAAQTKFEDADQRATDLKAQAAAAQARADQARILAGRLGAQLYRSGGSDLSLNLLIDGSSASSDLLLARLGSMSKLVQRSAEIYSAARAAQNEAQALQAQATIALKERAKLQAIAKAAYDKAAAAQRAYQVQVDASNAHADELKAQLAALNASTNALVASYRHGVAVRRAAALARAKAEAAARGMTVSDAGWTRPGNGYLSDGFGPRTPIWTGYGWTNAFHHGQDIAQACGSPIYAASGGTIIFAGWNGGLGFHVRIDHGGGIESSYSHIESGGILVHIGEVVAPGQKIALTGTTGESTGCHLHFMIYRDGSPINPLPFLRARGVNI